MIRYLREGLDNDDSYIMVEDEFYAVAQTFTKHLHYAEYVKKKEEVKRQNETTIGELARPTDGTPISGETKKRKEAEALSARQKTGLDQPQDGNPGVNAEGEIKLDDLDDPEENADWAGTFLYDLMTSPRKARSLVGFQGVRSSTRAAAGYPKQAGYGSSQADRSSSLHAVSRDEEQRLEETASEDDDLDLQANLSTPRPIQRGNGANPGALITRNSPARTHSHIKSEEKEIRSIHARYKPPTSFKSRKKKLFDGLDDFDKLPELNKPKIPIQRQRNTHFARGNHGKDSTGDEPESKKSRLNEVPTFLL